MSFSNLREMNSKIPEWISHGFTSEEDIKLVQGFGKYLAKGIESRDRNKRNKRVNGITTSKIRSVYTEFTRLKVRDELSDHDFLMLIPRLAYMAARGKSKAYDDLKSVLTTGIKSVNKSKDKKKAFNQLTNMFESILAYHKYYGGKDS